MNFLKTLSTGAVLASPLLALAQYQAPPPAAAALIERLTGVAIGIIIAISVLFVIWGAFKFLISGGDPTATKEARDIVIYALVAIGVALLARVLVNVAVDIFRF